MFPFSEEAMTSYRKIPVDVDAILVSAIQHVERARCGTRREVDCIYQLFDEVVAAFPTEFATLTTETLRILLHRACRPPRITAVKEEGIRSALQVRSCIL